MKSILYRHDQGRRCRLGEDEFLEVMQDFGDIIPLEEVRSDQGRFTGKMVKSTARRR